MCPPPGDGGAEGSDGTSSVGSIDPNDKAGPTGVTAHHWISAWDPVPYLVSFENEPTASAPAQQVVVTDHLDPTTVDLTSFSFGPIAFGDGGYPPARSDPVQPHRGPPAGAGPARARCRHARYAVGCRHVDLRLDRPRDGVAAGRSNGGLPAA